MGSEIRTNEDKLLEILATLSPEMWEIGKRIKLLNLDTEDLSFIPDAVEGIWKVKMGSGWGSITLQIQDGEVTGINVTETRVRLKVEPQKPRCL